MTVKDNLSSDPSAGLRWLKTTAPAAPDFESIMRAALAARAICSTQTNAGIWTKAAVALTAFALVGVALQMLAVRPATAKLTPLRVINASWSAAEGYVLEFDIFEEDPGRGKSYGDRQGPNYQRFYATAYEWAERHGLSHPDDDWAMVRPDVGLAILRTGGGRADGQYKTTRAQVNVRVSDQALIDDLVKMLASLPGVAEPEVTQLTIYFGLGGLTPAMDAAKVIIDGTSYEFPEDFGPYEAQSLYWSYRGVSDGSVRYQAFPADLLARGFGETLEEAQSSRFPLGDVIRIALDEDDNLTVDTVRETWDIEVKENDNYGHARGGGWVISIPPDIDEASIDPYAELLRKLNPSPEDRRGHRYIANVEFWFVPLTQLKTQGGLSISAAQKELADDLVPKLQAKFHEWKDAHPEVKRSIAFGDRAHGGPIKAGINTAGFVVGIRTDDLSEVNSLKAVITTIDGLPPAEERMLDMEVERQR